MPKEESRTDGEVKALFEIVHLLEGMTIFSKNRIMNYLNDRYGKKGEPDAQENQS